MDTSGLTVMTANDIYQHCHRKGEMAKSKKELEAQLKAFKSEVSKYEGLRDRALKDGDKKKAADYAMAVAGLKNSIREIGTQLRNM
ncbi:hypothetical protein [Streptomyces sp. JV178]|nr:hypothetical protein [Streptomyces sp. JV178]